MSRRLDRARLLLRRRLTGRGIALAVVGVASLAAAVLSIRTNRPMPSPSVRRVMAPFRPDSDGGRGYGAILADAARGASDRPDFALVLPAAGEAKAAAGRMRGLVRGPMAALWDRHTTDLERSAAELERACRDADAPAVIAAARRLDASCTSCHAVFGPREQGEPAFQVNSPRRDGATSRIETGRSPPPRSNEWVEASVTIGQPVCWVTAADGRAMPARPA